MDEHFRWNKFVMDECVVIALVHECCGNEWDELVLMEITHICNMNYVARMWHNGITCPHKWIGIRWINMIIVDIQIPCDPLDELKDGEWFYKEGYNEL